MKDLRTAQGLSPVGKGPKCSHSTPNTKRKSTDADKENVHPSKRQCPSDKISQRVVLHPVKLTKEQLRVLEVVVRGESLFFTGSAGTGKSFLLRRILGSLPPDHTFATASTGVAACQIGGTTLHSFAGIGSGKGTIETCAELARRPAVMQQWKKCRHLIIDEISMVDGEFFDKMECVARTHPFTIKSISFPSFKQNMWAVMSYL
ncbi:PIF1 [Acanthosepion pharaonis]|uniref:ATP-dependent DNA helicase n=1 Tax=Acanthosepion pharaonis TaxID=158019 RepID=A0A812CKE7_ACAPH|nr:PIF1 [Sepia pharaonis]